MASLKDFYDVDALVKYHRIDVGELRRSESHGYRGTSDDDLLQAAFIVDMCRAFRCNDAQLDERIMRVAPRVVTWMLGNIPHLSEFAHEMYVHMFSRAPKFEDPWRTPSVARMFTDPFRAPIPRHYAVFSRVFLCPEIFAIMHDLLGRLAYREAITTENVVAVCRAMGQKLQFSVRAVQQEAEEAKRAEAAAAAPSVAPPTAVADAPSVDKIAEGEEGGEEEGVENEEGGEEEGAEGEEGGEEAMMAEEDGEDESEEGEDGSEEDEEGNNGSEEESAADDGNAASDEDDGDDTDTAALEALFPESE